MTRSRDLGERLARVESRNIAGEASLFWERAAGARVEDAEGKSYIDFTSAFGVASIGHSHPYLIDTLHQAATRLIAGMGDVHPNEAKVEILEALSDLYPGGGAKGILSLSGSEAVEAVMKTARIATGRDGILAFEGAYHGLTYGALRVTHESRFSGPFAEALARAEFAPYPNAEVPASAEASLAAAEKILRAGKTGLVLIEPIQGRAGIVVPPGGFLRDLAGLARANGALFAVDEVYTGVGRTGRFFACEWDGVVPDLIALGKGLGGGIPISACLGRTEVMDTWPPAEGEAIHTSTFLGYPFGCAAAVATIEILRNDGLLERAVRIGEIVRRELEPLAEDAHVRLRGRGALWGLVAPKTERVVRTAQGRGLLLLPQGPRREVLAISPPLVIEEETLVEGLGILRRAVRETLEG